MKKILTSMLMLAAFAVTGTAQDTWTVAGTAAALNGTADWTPSNTENDMTSSDGVNYTLTVTDCNLETGTIYKFKVVKNHDWAECYGDDVNGDVDGNKTFTVDETAKYTVEYTFNASTHAVGVSTTKTGDASYTYTVAGFTELVGSYWDPTDTSNDMVLDGDVYKLAKNNVHLAVGTYEFKVVQDHAWTVAYPASNYKLEIATEANYNILFTFNASTKEVGCTATQLLPIGIGATGWGTWYTANALDFSGMSFSAYTATCDGTKVTLTKVNDVQDGTAFVLKGSEGTYYVPLTDASSTDKGQLSFPTDFTVWAGDDCYVYGLIYDDVNGKAKFAQVAEGVNVGGHVILRVEKSLVDASARESLEVVFAGETTGISSVNAKANDGVYYNLQGVRVAQPTKGLYIVNGKKMLVK